MRVLLLLLLLLLFSCNTDIGPEFTVTDESEAPQRSLQLVVLPDHNVPLTSVEVLKSGLWVPLTKENSFFIDTLWHSEKDVALTLRFTRTSGMTSTTQSFVNYHKNAPLLISPEGTMSFTLLNHRIFGSFIAKKLINKSDTLQLHGNGTATHSIDGDTAVWFQDRDRKIKLFWGDSLEENIYINSENYYRLIYTPENNGVRTLREISTYTYLPLVELHRGYQTTTSRLHLYCTYEHWHDSTSSAIVYFDTTETINTATARSVIVTDDHAIFLDSLREYTLYQVKLFYFRSDGSLYTQSDQQAFRTDNSTPKRCPISDKFIGDTYCRIKFKENPIDDFSYYQIRWQREDEWSDTLWEDTILLENPESTETFLTDLTPSISYRLNARLYDRGKRYADTSFYIRTKVEHFDVPNVTTYFYSDSIARLQWYSYKGEQFASYAVYCKNLTNSESGHDTVWTSTRITDTTVTFHSVFRYEDIYSLQVVAMRSDGTVAAGPIETTRQPLLELSYNGLFERLELKWKSTKPYERFEIMRRLPNQSDFTLLKSVPAGSSFEVDLLSERGTHGYYIRAIDGDTVDSSSSQWYYYRP